MHSSVKKLRLQYEYCELELEDTEKEFAKRKEHFSSAFHKHYDKLSSLKKAIVDSSMNKEGEIKPKSGEPQSAIRTEDPGMHALFKQIAKETHPDKYATASEEIQFKKSLLFKEAKKMCENGDWIGLQKIAEDLSLSAPPLTEEQLEHVRLSIKKMDTKIHQIRTASAWKWYELSEEDKNNYMEQYYKQVFEFHEDKDAG